MRLNSPCCPLGLAAVLTLLGLTLSVRAGQDDPLRKQVVRLGQVTGKEALQAHFDELGKDKSHAHRLVATGAKMASAKDSDLTYAAALLLAKTAEDLKDYKACEALYRVCMDQAAKLCSFNMVLESYGGLIEALYRGKHYSAAVRICRELLELKTGDERPRVYRILVEDKAGEIGEVDVPDYDVTRPIRPDVHNMMIKALAKDAKYDQALKLTENLIRANPDDWNDRQLKGWVLREAGRFGEAAKVYEDVLERIGKDKDLSQKKKDNYTGQYRYELSNIYVDLKQIDHATDQLRWLVEHYPEEPGFYNDLGYIMADNDMNLQESETLIRKALDLDREARKKSPNFDAGKDMDKGAYLDSLGWVLFKQRKFEDAKKYLLEALKDTNSQHIEIFDHLGDTYMALGMREEAVSAWRQGLTVAGEDRREQERKRIVEKKLDKNK
jgi:tetratricopeptide (TPR) repeat protein